MFVAALMINLINLVIGIIEAFIGLRIILKLVSANPLTPVVSWIYETSRALIWPFQGMFPSPNLGGGSILEFNSLIALLAYAFIGYLLMLVVNATEHYGGRHYATGRKGRRVKEEEWEE